MKTSIALLSLILSANVFAYSVADSSALVTATPFITSVSSSDDFLAKEAVQVINDAQELIQDGRMSAFLNQKIKDIQSVHTEASESEALDLLIDQAEAALK